MCNIPESMSYSTYHPFPSYMADCMSREKIFENLGICFYKQAKVIGKILLQKTKDLVYMLSDD